MKISFKEVIIIGGAYASSFIGVGVASGQEVLQYFTNHGWMAFVAMAVFLIIGSWMVSTAMVLAKKDERAEGYSFYLGEKLGWVFNKIIIPAMCFLTVGALISGAGAIAETYFGISSWIGVSVMAAALFVTYLFDVNKMINILGFLGPVLIIFTAILCIYSLFNGGGISEGVKDIENNGDRLVISKYWWWGAIQYATFQTGLLLMFVARLGKRTDNTRTAIWGGTVGNLLIVAGFVLMTLAFMNHYSEISVAEVPTLELALKISPIFAVVYGIIIFLALYTTEAASYWVLCSSLPTAKKKIPNAIVAGVFAVIFVFGGQLPFSKAVNFIWPIIGYTTTVIAIFMFAGMIRYFVKKKRDGVQADSSEVK